MEMKIATVIDAIAAWCAERSATDVVNHSLVAVPSVWPPSQDLPWGEWATLNHFRTGQGRCENNADRWKQFADPQCSCCEIRTMTVNDCITTRFPGG